MENGKDGKLGEGNGDADQGIKTYWAQHNIRSIDGLDGLEIAPLADGTPRSQYTKETERGTTPTAAVASVEPKKSIGKPSDVALDPRAFLAGVSLGILLALLYARLGGVV